jgi:autotransporter family porin
MVRGRISRAEGLMIVLQACAAMAAVYVNQANTSDVKDGASWTTAFTQVQDGINAATAGQQVWVAKGTYYPTTTTDRARSVMLKSGVGVYGGFAGTEAALSQRSPVANVTTISGDIGAAGDSTDNSYHVVVGDSAALIDGFTICNGFANGKLYHRLGGGMYNAQADTVWIKNCIFSGNWAEEGGAMYNYKKTYPKIDSCTFVGNNAYKGGALVCRDFANAACSGCTFSKNSAEWRGGAVYIDYGSDPRFSGCTFAENSTAGNGGAVYTDDLASQADDKKTSPSMTGCTFTSNTAKYRGGAVDAIATGVSMTIANSIFSNNKAGAGGGAIAIEYQASITATGCTYTGNTGGSGDADIDDDRAVNTIWP